jgi:hypothetical protein
MILSVRRRTVSGRYRKVQSNCSSTSSRCSQRNEKKIGENEGDNGVHAQATSPIIMTTAPAKTIAHGLCSGRVRRVRTSLQRGADQFFDLIAFTQYLFDSLHDWHLKILLVAAIIRHLAQVFFQGL